MFKKTVYLSIIFFAAILTSVKAADLPYKEGELLIRFAPKADGIQRTTDERNQILSSFNAGTVKGSVRLVPGLSVVKLPVNLTVADALPRLRGKSEILYVEPNYKIRLASIFPNDTRFDEMWAMHNTGQTGGTVDADIDAPEAWNLVTDSNVIVAVIDTGVDYTHPDLSTNMWVNQEELNGDPNVDDDGNGYIDDVYGYDFCTYDDGQEDPDPWDDYGHGTHCAGTIGAVGNNDEGVTGVCWNVKIMALKFIASSGYGWSYDAIKCIEYAVDNGAKVLSNSWRYYEGWSQFVDPEALREAIEAADTNGVLFVAAAGNEGYDNDYYPAYPASYDCNNIISVMATDHDDQRSIWGGQSSNYGLTTVDLAAPGSDILSCVPGDSYESWGGTSMATPHVAGACALVWAANPQLTHLEVKDYILQGVDKLDSLAGLCVTEGRLNLWRAVKGKAAFPYLTLTKDVDDANCVYPFEPFIGNYLNYEICYDANGSADTNVVIVDYLPDEVLYHSSEPNGYYDDVNHTVTWNIGNISADDSNCITLTVKVTADAEPGGTITNTCEIEGDSYIATASNATCVECWAGEILYVDADANDGGDGLSWQTAYNDLQDALDATQTCDCYTAIWVAAGTYKPTYDTNETNYQSKSFELLEDVGLFGHFGGIGTYETSTTQRNFADANNETILDGQIGENYWEAIYYIVKAEGVTNGLIDGFTIKGSYSGAGIYLNEADVGIVNSKFKNKYGYGIYAQNYSYPDIHNCTFIDNSNSGIYSSTSQPDISYSILDGNNSTYYGLYMESGSSIDVTNSVFKNHTYYGVSGSGGILDVEGSSFEKNNQGLYISDVTTTLSGSSIKQSLYYGIWASNSDLTVERSVIHGSQYNNGIYMQSFSNLDLINSVIRYSGAHGLSLSQNSQTNIKNCWIHNNGVYYGGSGIYFDYPVENPLVRNNTIYDNNSYGIQVSAALSVDPNICNCIIAGNDSNDLYRVNGSFNKVNYCLLQHAHSGIGNITGDPGFMNPADPNDLHLDETSQCKDVGDPNGNYSNETDIDGENRVYYGRVDIGADEYYWSSADFDRDKIVNFLDYAVLASAWLTDNPNISLDDDNDVDIYDLSLFCQDWLWEAPWSDTQWMMSMGSGGSGMGLGLENSELALAGNRDALMLSTATESLKARPERLIARSRKFYDITPETTISAKRKALELQLQRQAGSKLKLQPEPALEPQPQYEPYLTTQELIDWLEELWLTDEEVRSTCTEADWLEFIETIRQTPVE